MVEQVRTRPALRVPASIGAAIALVIHIIVAIVLFGTITGGAVLLNLVTKWCEVRNLTPGWVIQGMHGLEFVLWAADVICFVLLVAVESWKFCVTVWNGRGEKR